MFEFRTSNTFGLRGFVSYGTFWISLAVLNIFARQFSIAPERLAEAQGWFFLAWTIFTIMMLIAAFGLNVRLIVTFVLLLATLVLLTIGDLQGGPEGPVALYVKVGGVRWSRTDCGPVVRRSSGRDRRIRVYGFPVGWAYGFPVGARG